MGASKITRQYQNPLIVSQTPDGEYGIAEPAIGISTDSNGLIYMAQDGDTIILNHRTVTDLIKALRMTCAALAEEGEK